MCIRFSNIAPLYGLQHSQKLVIYLMSYGKIYWARCQHVPGLPKLFYEKCLCVYTYHLSTYLCMFVRIQPHEQKFKVVKVGSKS